MGSNDGEADERPVHQESVADFELDETEVSVGQYRACAAAGGCSVLPVTSSASASDPGDQLWSKFCNAARSGRELHPINCVDHAQAEQYCV